MIHRGEIWRVDFGVPKGSEAGYERPVVIVQDDHLNAKDFRTVLVVPLSSVITSKIDANCAILPAAATALPKDSVALATLLTAINRSELKRFVSRLDEFHLEEVEFAILTALGMTDW